MAYHAGSDARPHEQHEQDREGGRTEGPIAEVRGPISELRGPISVSEAAEGFDVRHDHRRVRLPWGLSRSPVDCDAARQDGSAREEAAPVLGTLAPLSLRGQRSGSARPPGGDPLGRPASTRWARSPTRVGAVCAVQRSEEWECMWIVVLCAVDSLEVGTARLEAGVAVAIGGRAVMASPREPRQGGGEATAARWMRKTSPPPLPPSPLASRHRRRPHARWQPKGRWCGGNCASHA